MGKMNTMVLQAQRTFVSSCMRVFKECIDQGRKPSPDELDHLSEKFQTMDNTNCIQSNMRPRDGQHYPSLKNIIKKYFSYYRMQMDGIIEDDVDIVPPFIDHTNKSCRTYEYTSPNSDPFGVGRENLTLYAWNAPMRSTRKIQDVNNFYESTAQRQRFNYVPDNEHRSDQQSDPHSCRSGYKETCMEIEKWFMTLRQNETFDNWFKCKMAVKYELPVPITEQERSFHGNIMELYNAFETRLERTGLTAGDGLLSTPEASTPMIPPLSGPPPVLATPSEPLWNV